MTDNKTVFYKRVFVWSGFLRLFHWVFAISTTVLVISGIYIHFPPITTKWAEFNPTNLMATLRYYHYLFAFFFMASLIIRTYLLFFGNKYERLTDFIPINKTNIRSMYRTVNFYLYLTDDHECRMGHTVVAGTSYFLLFICAFFITLTGLYLMYPETNWINTMGVMIFGSPQLARLIHYLLNWAFIIFTLIHLYIAVWNDIKVPEGLISGAFSGTKFIPATPDEIRSDTAGAGILKET